jgi:hypothetical protein
MPQERPTARAVRAAALAVLVLTVLNGTSGADVWGSPGGRTDPCAPTCPCDAADSAVSRPEAVERGGDASIAHAEPAPDEAPGGDCADDCTDCGCSRSTAPAVLVGALAGGAPVRRIVRPRPTSDAPAPGARSDVFRPPRVSA